MGRYFLFILFLFLYTKQTRCSVQVETKYGTVEGEVLSLEEEFEGVSVNTFFGIPYARPPVGQYRFLPPEEPEPWEGVLEAKELPSACIQNPAMMYLTHLLWNDFSEDCLTINIVAPNSTDGSYPVMVWIHGGAFIFGSHVQYPGHFLAAQDVVVVLMNYRLDIFGFAFSGDEDAPGNMGMLDQVLALRFVQENIAAFGGDSDQVTIFGESAGGISVGFHVMSPLSAGLFHQAIYQSGTEFHKSGFYGANHDPIRYLKEVAEYHNCSTENPDMVECLRRIPAVILDRHSNKFNCTPGLSCTNFQPIVGDLNGFLPDNPGDIREREEFNKVPIMTGLEQEDYAFFAIPYDWARFDGPNRTEFQRALRDIADFNSAYFPDEGRADTVYQAMDFFYTPWPHTDDSWQNRYQLVMMYTDTGFGLSTDMTARYHSEYAPTYQYVHAYRPEDMGLPTSDWMGTFHMCDLIYMFGMPLLEHNPAVKNQTDIQPGYMVFEEKDFEYSLLMMEMWTNFAKYGNPTPEPVTLPPSVGGGSFSWEPFTPDHHDYCYLGNHTVEMRENYRSQEYAFWEDYYQWIVFGDEGHVPGGGEFLL